jgi:hypothetical protein
MTVALIDEQEPKYTMRPKTEAKIDQTVPGPGQYHPNYDPAREHHTAVRIGREERGGDSVNPGPGPGQYFDNGKSELTQIGTKFGNEERGKTGTKDVPGPGNYPLEGQFEEAGRTNKGKTFGIKTDIDHINNNPAPGAYDPEVYPVRPAAPSRTFGSSRDDTHPPSTVPGPGTYENLIPKSTPAWRVGTGQRSDMEPITADFPGPGTYEYEKPGRGYKVIYFSISSHTELSYQARTILESQVQANTSLESKQSKRRDLNTGLGQSPETE